MLCLQNAMAFLLSNTWRDRSSCRGNGLLSCLSRGYVPCTGTLVAEELNVNLISIWYCTLVRAFCHNGNGSSPDSNIYPYSSCCYMLAALNFFPQPGRLTYFFKQHEYSACFAYILIKSQHTSCKKQRQEEYPFLVDQLSNNTFLR